MKFVCLFVLLAFTVGNLHSLRRTYTIVVERVLNENRLLNYTIYDASGMKRLYRMRTLQNDIDTILLVDYPTKNLVGICEGEWAWDKIDVSFSIYSYASSKWIDGKITKAFHLLRQKYFIKWNSKNVTMRGGIFSKAMHFYAGQDELYIGQFRDASSWYTTNAKYELQIDSTYMPEQIYFFAVAMISHRTQQSDDDDDDDE